MKRNEEKIVSTYVCFEAKQKIWKQKEKYGSKMKRKKNKKYGSKKQSKKKNTKVKRKVPKRKENEEMNTIVCCFMVMPNNIFTINESMLSFHTTKTKQQRKLLL
jgi:predicted DNA repair protein MutK